jgi:hypothetical protein
VSISGLRETLVERANAVSIIDVLQDDFSIHVPFDDKLDRSWKTSCPFAYEHSDGGLDKQYRVYAHTNTSFCFEMHGLLTPVRLIAYKYTYSPQRAATSILEHYGLLKPKDYRERYQELVLARTREDSALQTEYLVEALQSSVRAVNPDAQFDVAFQATFAEALSTLDDLAQRRVSLDDISKWYSAARTALTEKAAQIGRT